MAILVVSRRDHSCLFFSRCNNCVIICVKRVTHLEVHLLIRRAEGRSSMSLKNIGELSVPH
jgi:hypothetical protein